MAGIRYTKQYGILIHGGLKTKKIKKAGEKAEKITKSLKDSISGGYELLKKGNSAVDAVETSVVNMENSGNFNAGIGSCLTIDKQIEMDASIMNGIDISAGTVGMVKGVQNPIRLARYVMEHSNHIMLVSNGVIEFAKVLGIYSDKINISKSKLKLYEKLKRNYNEAKYKNKSTTLSPQSPHYYDTVGSIAMDKGGNVAVAVSTGGRWLKTSGRIGDAGVIGSGFYADNKFGAACATGYGEYMMRLCLCKYACDHMKHHNAIGR